MADDQLRMSATVTDGFSGPLKSLQAQLSAIAANPVGKALNKDWQSVGASIEKATAGLRTGFAPVISTIGIGSLGIASGFASATLALKSFAFSTREMSIFSRQIGMSVGQLKEMKAIGERFGVDWGQAQGSLKTFAGNIDQLQRRWGDAYGRLRAMNLGNLAEDLVKAPDLKTAIDKALDGIRSIQNPVRRREVAELLFGSDQWATVASELSPKVRAEIRKMASEVTTETQRAADEFVENWIKMEKAVDRFTTKAVAPALKPIAEMMELLSKPVGGELTRFFENLKTVIDKMGDWHASFDFRSGIKMRTPFDAMMGNDSTAPTLTELERRRAMIQRQLDDPVGFSTEARRQRAIEEIKRLADEIEKLRKGGATVQQQSFMGGGGLGGLIQTAAFGGSGLGFRGFGGSGGGGGGGGGGIRGALPAPGPGTGIGHVASRAEREAFIRKEAAARGIDPDTAMRIARSEGFNRYVGDQGRSFGDWQLYTGGGLGNEFHRDTGLDPRDPKTWREQTRYALDWAAKNRSWRPWHGRGPAGVGVNEGFGPTSRPLGWKPREGEPADAAASAGKMVAEAMVDRFARFSSGFGMRNHPFGGVRPHEGVDMAAPAGSAFRARRGGEVIGVSPSGDVTVRYEDGSTGTYRHGAPSVAVGDQVRQGQQLGVLRGGRGTPGGDWRSTGPHLHYESRDRDGRLVDPTEMLRSRGDSMMGRAFGAGGIGAGAPKLDATGSVNITLTGGLEKAPARVSMDGLFKDVKVNRRADPANTGDASP